MVTDMIGTAGNRGDALTLRQNLKAFPRRDPWPALLDILNCSMEDLIEPIAAGASARPRKAAGGSTGGSSAGVGSFRPKSARITR